MLRQILSRLTADPVARAMVGMPSTPKASMNQIRRMWQALNVAILRRDKGMAKKLGGLFDRGDEIIVDRKTHREIQIMDDGYRVMSLGTTPQSAIDNYQPRTESPPPPGEKDVPLF